jgi:hypothetical protein
MKRVLAKGGVKVEGTLGIAVDPMEWNCRLAEWV